MDLYGVLEGIYRGSLKGSLVFLEKSTEVPWKGLKAVGAFQATTIRTDHSLGFRV